MKRNKKFYLIYPTALLLAGALLMQGCGQKDPNAKEPGDSTATNEHTYIYENMNYSYKTDESAFLSDILTGMSQDYLLLVNKNHPLINAYNPASSSYILESMVTLDRQVTKNGMELEARTARALYAMLAEMAADGVTDIQITSAYRDETYQSGTYAYWWGQEMLRISEDAESYYKKKYAGTDYDYLWENYRSKGLTSLNEADAKEVANFYSALPGQSEHHTGLCIDFRTSTAGLTRAFENTDAFRWLSENCYRFGFILRYPEEKEDITGYFYEPWHYRLVGREAATEIMLGHLTLEEFLGINETYF